jgi:hypothetical protein
MVMGSKQPHWRDGEGIKGNLHSNTTVTQLRVDTQELNGVENLTHGSKSQTPSCKMAHVILKEIGVWEIWW